MSNDNNSELKNLMSTDPDELLGKAYNSNLVVLNALSTSSNDDLIEKVLQLDAKSQVQAFKIIQAKNELIRVLKMTQSLNMLEDAYVERALADRDGMDMQSLARVIDVVMKSVDRSNMLLDKFTNDDSISLVIDQSTTIASQYNQNTAISVIEDQTSRNKLRSITSKLYDYFKDNENIDNKIVESLAIESGDNEDEDSEDIDE